jgi:site-specific DNA-methyltransferase (adenine-specific)
MIASRIQKAGRKTTTYSSGNGRPKYQVLPDLPPEEFEALKADIAQRGVQYAVIQDEKGNTLDGHQRERAVSELGITKYPITVIPGLSAEEKRHLALSLNVKRRHLTRPQMQALIEQELKRTPDIASQWLGEILGVDTKTVQAARRRLEATLEIPVLKKLRGKDGKNRVATYSRVVANTARELKIARAVASKLPPSCHGRIIDTITAGRHARRQERTEARDGRSVKRLSLDSIKLFHCPFQKLERVAGIRPSSVDLVLTDVPFGKEFLSQLCELAAFAERVLVKGGLFVTYTGQYYLPQVMEAFGKHLTYRWAAMSTWDGDSNLIHPLNIASQCKPILVYTKGPWTKRDRWGDVFFAATKEKRWHPWQQSLEEVERLVRYFSEPGDLVCDPCSGGATTAAACFNLGRRCIACDCEKEYVARGKKRLAAMIAQEKGKPKPR